MVSSLSMLLATFFMLTSLMAATPVLKEDKMTSTNTVSKQGWPGSVASIPAMVVDRKSSSSTANTVSKMSKMGNKKASTNKFSTALVDLTEKALNWADRLEDMAKQQQE